VNVRVFPPHDPLCPQPVAALSRPGLTVIAGSCHCKTIAKVREQERIRIVAAVGRIADDGHWHLGIGPVITAIMDEQR
jgi:hypothetical protein